MDDSDLDPDSPISPLPDLAEVDLEAGLEAELEADLEMTRLQSQYTSLQARVKHLFDQTEASTICEGDRWYQIPSTWLLQFFSQPYVSIAEAKAGLGPVTYPPLMDTFGVLKPGVDLTPIPTQALELITATFGVVGTPIQSFAIWKEGQLVMENHPPVFEIHLISTTRPKGTKATGIRKRHSISALAKVEQLMATLLKANALAGPIRLWHLSDYSGPRINKVGDLVEVANKNLILPSAYPLTLRSIPLLHGDLVIDLADSQGVFVTQRERSVVPGGTCGLANLGNSCYMNLALQCLVHIPEMALYFAGGSYEHDLNVKNPLGMNGKVANAFGALVKKIYGDGPIPNPLGGSCQSSDASGQPSATNDELLRGNPAQLSPRTPSGVTYTPREFKNTIGHYGPMFQGYQQQDSQEFLAFLLDALHEDLNRILQKPFVEKPELDSTQALDREAVGRLAQRCWDQHRMRNDSVIVDLFVGLYKSTVVCPTCERVSITFDPYSDLTLPLPVENLWCFTVKVFTDGLYCLDVELPKSCTFKDLKHYVSQRVGVAAESLYGYEVYGHDQFYRDFQSDESVGYMPLSTLISPGDELYFYHLEISEGDLVVPVFNVLGSTDVLVSGAAFAFPYFVVLSAQEREQPGSLRRRLEQKLTALSTHIPGAYPPPVTYSQDSDNAVERDLDGAVSGGADVGDPDGAFKRGALVGETSMNPASPQQPLDFDSRPFTIRILDHKQDRRKYNWNHRVEPAIWIPTTSNFANLQVLDETVGSEETSSPPDSPSASDGPGSLAPHDSLENTPTFGCGALSLGTTLLEPMMVDSRSPSCVSDLETEQTGGLRSTLSVYEAELAAPLPPSDELEYPPSVHSDASLDLYEDAVQVASPALTAPAAPLETEAPARPGLIQAKQAAICVWNQDSFSLYFTGLEANGGTEKFSTPRKIPNPELEAKRATSAQAAQSHITLDGCLRLFSRPEVLGDQDLWYCPHCKDHRQATKTIELWKTPDILTIHLKRFEGQGQTTDKIDDVVDFPIEGLDMLKYVVNQEEGESLVYDLCAVDNHFGGLGGGHYTAYAKNGSQWFYYDDSRVTETTPEKAVAGSAYLLFYRKRAAGSLGGATLAQALQASTERAQQVAETRKSRWAETKLQDRAYRHELEALDAARSTVAAEVEDSASPDLDSEEEVSSINCGMPVDGTDNETRRKQRLLTRPKRNKYLEDVWKLDSEGDSVDGSACSSPFSPVCSPPRESQDPAGEWGVTPYAE